MFSGLQYSDQQAGFAFFLILNIHFDLSIFWLDCHAFNFTRQINYIPSLQVLLAS